MPANYANSANTIGIGLPLHLSTFWSDCFCPPCKRRAKRLAECNVATTSNSGDWRCRTIILLSISFPWAHKMRVVAPTSLPCGLIWSRPPWRAPMTCRKTFLRRPTMCLSKQSDGSEVDHNPCLFVLVLSHRRCSSTNIHPRVGECFAKVGQYRYSAKSHRNVHS